MTPINSNDKLLLTDDKIRYPEVMLTSQTLGQRNGHVDHNSVKLQEKMRSSAKQTKEVSTHQQKKKHVAYGDDDFSIGDFTFEEYDTADWDEIQKTCCHRSSMEWVVILACLVGLILVLYMLVLGLGLIGTGAQVMAGCWAASLFGADYKPLSNVMIGLLTTVLLQSSGTATSIIISLEASNILTPSEGIYMIMGCNIGTCVTVAVVSLAHFRNCGNLERSFSMASQHFLFNFMTVMILFPLELTTGYLSTLTRTIVEGSDMLGGQGEMYQGPVYKFVVPVLSRLIINNKKVIEEVASGASCSSFYPIECESEVSPSYSTCKTGLIACNKKTDMCPLFFDESATRSQDQAYGFLSFLLGATIVVVATLAMISIIQKLLQGMAPKVVHTVTNWNGYVGIIFGTGFTLLVQSSSITTSLLIPFAGVGAVRLEQLFPIILGANLGTAIQPVIKSLYTHDEKALQVALAHLFFNLTGVLIWYPMPPLRNIILGGASRLGRSTTGKAILVLAFILSVYVLMPIFVLLIAMMYRKVAQPVAIFVTICCSLILAQIIFWFRFQNGCLKLSNFLKRKENVSAYSREGDNLISEESAVPDKA